MEKGETRGDIKEKLLRMDWEWNFEQVLSGLLVDFTSVDRQKTSLSARQGRTRSRLGDSKISAGLEGI